MCSATRRPRPRCARRCPCSPPRRASARSQAFLWGCRLASRSTPGAAISRKQASCCRVRSRNTRLPRSSHTLLQTSNRSSNLKQQNQVQEQLPCSLCAPTQPQCSRRASRVGPAGGEAASSPTSGETNFPHVPRNETRYKRSTRAAAAEGQQDRVERMEEMAWFRSLLEAWMTSRLSAKTPRSTCSSRSPRRLAVRLPLLPKSSRCSSNNHLPMLMRLLQALRASAALIRYLGLCRELSASRIRWPALGISGRAPQ